jgi:amino acid transporter
MQSLRDALLTSAQPPRRTAVTRNALGTLNGCYIPCLLNILGAPLFLFVGFAVGMVGWLGALALFFFSESIAYLTITSFSALVTNGRMRGGGAYYMISRSLGPALGGSSGILFWLTYCVNVTFNTTAFTDTVFSTWYGPLSPLAQCKMEDGCYLKLAFSSATLFLLFLVAFRGAGAFARINWFIFAGLVLSLVTSIGSLWFAPVDKIGVAHRSALQYTPSDLTYLKNVTASYRPWAWRAACPPSRAGELEWCHLGNSSGIGLAGGNGYYGLYETAAYAEIAVVDHSISARWTIASRRGGP